MARPDLRSALAVWFGGALGTGLRWTLGEALGGSADPAWVLTGINLLGALVLGMLVGRWSASRALVFLGTGVLGGFTTYSAFAAQTDALGRSGAWTAAALHAGITVIGGVTLAWLGLRWGRSR